MAAWVSFGVMSFGVKATHHTLRATLSRVNATQHTSSARSLLFSLHLRFKLEDEVLGIALPLDAVAAVNCREAAPLFGW